MIHTRNVTRLANTDCASIAPMINACNTLLPSKPPAAESLKSSSLVNYEAATADTRFLCHECYITVYLVQI